MKEKIIEMYLKEELIPSVIAKKLKITTEEVFQILHSEHYMAYPGSKRRWVLSLKNAIDFYIANPEYTSNKVANKFSITQESLSKNLKKLGIEVSERSKTKFNENVFDKIDTEEKAYWLGFICADGTICSEPLNKDCSHIHYNVSFCLALIDCGHLFKFDKFMNVEESKVKVYDYTDYTGRKKQRAIWTVANRHLWNTLNNLGCTPKKSLTLQYPHYLPKELRRHFARGYFDGDGSFGIYGSKSHGELSLNCVGTDDIVSNLFKDIIPDIYKYHHKDHSEKTLTINANATRAKQILDYMYKDCTIYLDRKFNKYIEVCRFLRKLKELSLRKIGEDCDVNTEII